jgi:hypothetical protein
LTIQRPLVGAAVLCGALLLAACNGSPEAGRVAPAPTSAVPSTTLTPTGSPTTSSAWSGDELKAITSAKARYLAARTAGQNALKDPTRATRDALEKAGNGGSWVITLAIEVDFQRSHGWYQAGNATIMAASVQSVNLRLEQPEVRLSTCIDSSRVVTRYRSTGKPVPMSQGNGSRHRFQSRLVLAPSVSTGKKMWFLVEEKVHGSC